MTSGVFERETDLRDDGVSAKRIRTANWSSLLAAFVAGFTALTIQVVCTRLAAQIFGSGTRTISTTIACSLLGLAIGSIVIGRLADKIRRPGIWLAGLLTLASVISIAIGLFGRAVALEIDQWMFAQFGTAGGLVVFCLATLVPLNFMVGGVLPILVKSSWQGSATDSVSNLFGPLYASETLGGTIAALSVGFFSIQNFGMRRTAIATGLFGLAGAVAVFRTQAILRESTSHDSAAEDLNRKTGADYFLLVIVALAGSTSLAMEVIWQRFFVVLFGSDTHSFAMISAAFLIGIAAGAMLASPVRKLVNDIRRLYAILLVLIACSVLAASLAMLAWIDNRSAAAWSTNLINNYPIWGRLGFSLATMLLPTTLIGIGLPVASEIWVSNQNAAGRRTGELYAAALIGNVVGLLASGYWLVPSFGLRSSIVVLSGVCLLAGLVGFWLLMPGKNKAINAATSNHQKLPSYAARIMVVVFVVCWLVLAQQVLHRKTQLGVYSNSKDWIVDFYQESGANTVAVIRSTQNSDARKMLIDGVSIGESGGGVDEKQQLLAHLPFLVNSGSQADQRVLTIGLGSGILAGELVANDFVSKVTCVELSPAVIEASSYFDDVNGGIQSNEKFDLVSMDGIRFLRETDQTFDVIVSDAKSRPGHAGNINFFTNDYYKLCNSRLSNNGVFVQWIAMNTPPEAIEIILGSFGGVFPFGHVAVAAPGSIFVVGSKQPLKLTQEQFESYLQKPASSSLTQYDWKHYQDFLSLYWLDQSSLNGIRIGDGLQNSFDLPSLEAMALKSSGFSPEQQSNHSLKTILALLQADQARDIEDSRFNNEPIDGDAVGQFSKDLLAGRNACLQIVSGEIAKSDKADGWLDATADYYQQALEFLPEISRQLETARIYRGLAATGKSNGNRAQEFSALSRLSDLNTSRAADHFRMGRILDAEGKQLEALDSYYRAAQLAPDSSEYETEFGFAMLRQKRFGQARARFAKVLRKDPNNAGAKLGLGVALKRLGDEAEGNRMVLEAFRSAPELQSKLRQLESELNAQ